MKIRLLSWALLLLWLVYFISPIDLLPDAIARPLGWLDDIIIGYFLWRWRNHLREVWSQLSSSGPDKSQSHKNASADETSHSKERTGSSSNKTQAFDPYEVLGVTPNASIEEIEKSYRSLVSKYHPDKVNHLGEEFQKMAHEKMIEIQRAYSELKR